MSAAADLAAWTAANLKAREAARQKPPKKDQALCIEDGCTEPRWIGKHRHCRCEAHHLAARRRQHRESKARAEAAVRAAIRAGGGAG